MTVSPGHQHKLGFDRAQQVAAAQQLPDYSTWRSALERRYSVMPPWYWNESTCRQNYASHIQSNLDWQTSQANINAGIIAFHEELGRSR